MRMIQVPQGLARHFQSRYDCIPHLYIAVECQCQCTIDLNGTKKCVLGPPEGDSGRDSRIVTQSRDLLEFAGTRFVTAPAYHVVPLRSLIRRLRRPVDPFLALGGNSATGTALLRDVSPYLMTGLSKSCFGKNFVSAAGEGW